jgi:enoyl-CoA hydratase
MDIELGTDKMIARIDGAVGHMIFNNPTRHNAVSLEMWEAAETILDAFESDTTVRVMVLSGAGGRSFVSGADISKFESERANQEAVATYNAKVQRVYARIEHFPRPTIAMIHGYCIGGGLNLAVACDLRICSNKAAFAMPAARLALGYPFDSIRRLTQAVGPGMAKALMFSAERIDAAEALRIGLVQRVLEPDALESHVESYAGRIAANAPLTIRAMKYISGQVLADPVARDLARCDEMVAACFASEDYVEGRTAFSEKREPRFKGR